MFFTRYKFYPIDTGGYVLMDDELDEQLLTCHNLEIIENLTKILNEMDLEYPDDVTKIH
jgi:hypothetical protein